MASRPWAQLTGLDGPPLECLPVVRGPDPPAMLLAQLKPPPATVAVSPSSSAGDSSLIARGPVASTSTCLGRLGASAAPRGMAAGIASRSSGRRGLSEVGTAVSAYQIQRRQGRRSFVAVPRNEDSVQLAISHAPEGTQRRPRWRQSCGRSRSGPCRGRPLAHISHQPRVRPGETLGSSSAAICKSIPATAGRD